MALFKALSLYNLLVQCSSAAKSISSTAALTGCSLGSSSEYIRHFFKALRSRRFNLFGSQCKIPVRSTYPPSSYAGQQCIYVGSIAHLRELCNRSPRSTVLRHPPRCLFICFTSQLLLCPSPGCMQFCSHNFELANHFCHQSASKLMKICNREQVLNNATGAQQETHLLLWHHAPAATLLAESPCAPSNHRLSISPAEALYVLLLLQQPCLPVPAASGAPLPPSSPALAPAYTGVAFCNCLLSWTS